MPFYREIEKEINTKRLDSRSIVAVIILEDIIKNNRENQGAMVFGQGHQDLIIEELNYRKLSYIVMGTKLRREIEKKLIEKVMGK